MKKIIFLSIICLYSVRIFAVDSTLVATTKVSSEVNAIMNNVFDQTTEAVKQISDALKVPAEHVYSVLVKQQTVKSIGLLVIPFFFIVFTIAFYRFHKYGMSPSKKYKGRDVYYENGDYCAFPITSGIIALLLLIATISFIPNIIQGFINPEYGAIKEILNILK